MKVQSELIKRVVVRGTNWVNDSPVMTVPALRALRRVLPDAHITLAIRPGARGIFSEADFIDDVLRLRQERSAVGDSADPRVEASQV